MSQRMSDDAAPAQLGELEHVTVRNDGEPSTCTIFPRDCSEEKLVTHWITAEERSFVALDRWQ